MFYLVLEHKPNIDLTGSQQPGEIPGYWQAPKDDGRPQVISVGSIEEAQEASRDYIKRNGLGGGNWTGGAVADETGRPVGKISYNGRYWPYVLRGGRYVDPNFPEFSFNLASFMTVM